MVRKNKIRLCLSQIPSASEGRRRITATNQVFGPRFAGSNREIHEQKEPCSVENQRTFHWIR
jgi:hypothetical protein